MSTKTNNMLGMDKNKCKYNSHLGLFLIALRDNVVLKTKIRVKDMGVYNRYKSKIWNHNKTKERREKLKEYCSKIHRLQVM